MFLKYLAKMDLIGRKPKVYDARQLVEFPFRLFFRDFFGAPNQKLNLELSFETQSSHQSFSAVKMKLFELNS